MTLKDAREVQRFVTVRTSYYCVVPLGYKPDRYFVKIGSLDGKGRQFASMAEARKYVAEYLWKRRAAEKDRPRFEAWLERLRNPRPRSPLGIMIDRACGLP